MFIYQIRFICIYDQARSYVEADEAIRYCLNAFYPKINVIQQKLFKKETHPFLVLATGLMIHSHLLLLKTWRTNVIHLASTVIYIASHIISIVPVFPKLFTDSSLIRDSIVIEQLFLCLVKRAAHPSLENTALSHASNHHIRIPRRASMFRYKPSTLLTHHGLITGDE